VFVKICGITNEADGLMATAMGTDAVGFVFAPSSRRIQPTVARDIARRLPPEVLTVGVFRDEAPQRVVEIMNTAGLRGAQLHGFESPGEVAWVRKRVPFVLKAFSAGHPLVERAGDYDVDAILIDGSAPGSGETFDWSVTDNLPPGVPVILAGGLRPSNVADAIRRVHPWGVDVSSGVESSPGHKDVRLTRRFINVAKAVGSIHGTAGPASIDLVPHLGDEPVGHDGHGGIRADGGLSSGTDPQSGGDPDDHRFDPDWADDDGPHQGSLYDWDDDTAPAP
jgi:phosphoribosylanthranilate isomerase